MIVLRLVEKIVAGVDELVLLFHAAAARPFVGDDSDRVRSLGKQASVRLE